MGRRHILGWPVFFHTQNLSDGAKPLWQYGRCWWRVYPRWSDPDYEDVRGRTLRLEWSAPTSHLHVYADVGNTDEDDITLAVACRLFAAWASLEDVFPRSWRYRKGADGHYLPDKSIGLSWHNGGLYWHVWTPRDEWHRSTPRWRDGSWHPVDTLLGRRVHRMVEGEPEPCEIVMPEASYPATARRYVQTWTRPRFPWWPLTKRRSGVEIDIPRGVPVPGKGENSWDCGDDAIMSTGVALPPHGSIREASEKVALDALRTRQRYASLDWRPSEVAS